MRDNRLVRIIGNKNGLTAVVVGFSPFTMFSVEAEYLKQMAPPGWPLEALSDQLFCSALQDYCRWRLAAVTTSDDFRDAERAMGKVIDVMMEAFTEIVSSYRRWNQAKEPNPASDIYFSGIKTGQNTGAIFGDQLWKECRTQAIEFLDTYDPIAFATALGDLPSNLWDKESGADALRRADKTIDKMMSFPAAVQKEFVKRYVLPSDTLGLELKGKPLSDFWQVRDQ